MKIRTGFVSNSSGSSFYLVHIPEDFDFYAYKEYLIAKYKKKKYQLDYINQVTEDDMKYLMLKGSCYQGDNDERYYKLSEFLNELVILNVETQEESGWIKVSDKKFFDKIDQINISVRENMLIYHDIAKEKRLKREIMKDKMKGIDPYGEEDWGDEEEDVSESLKLKKFKDI